MDSTAQAPERLVKVEEAAHFLALSPRTVRDMAQSGALPSVKLGAARRFRLSELKAWVDAQQPNAA